MSFCCMIVFFLTLLLTFEFLWSLRAVITTPRNFVVETDTEYAEDWNSRVFYLRWSSAETMVDNYTIVWCRGSKWRRNCDPDVSLLGFFFIKFRRKRMIKHTHTWRVLFLLVSSFYGRPFLQRSGSTS